MDISQQELSSAFKMILDAEKKNPNDMEFGKKAREVVRKFLNLETSDTKKFPSFYMEQ